MSLLGKSIVGIDISDKTIKIVELSGRKSKIKISARAHAKLPIGVVEHGKIVDKEELKKIIEVMLDKAKPHSIKCRRIVFGFPDESVFTHTFVIKNIPERELREHLPKMIQKVVPLPINDLFYSYKIKNKLKGKLVTVVAAQKSIVDEWKSFFHSLSFTIEYFDVQSYALRRVLNLQKNNDAYLLLDIGSKTTNVWLFAVNRLVYSRTIFIGGDDFSDESDEVMEQFIEDVSNSVKQAKKKIKERKIVGILSGQASEIESLRKNINNNTDIIFKYISTPFFSGKKARIYALAVGLCLKEIQSKWQKIDLSIPLSMSRYNLSKGEDISLNNKKIVLISDEDFNDSKNLQSSERVDDKQGAPKDGDRSKQNLEEAEEKSKKMSKTQKEIISFLVVLIVGASLVFLVLNNQEKKRSDKLLDQQQNILKQLEEIPQ